VAWVRKEPRHCCLGTARWNESSLTDFVEQADQLKLYKRIVTMDATAPLPPPDDRAPKWDKGPYLTCSSMGARRLADRLEELAASSAAATG